MYVRDLEPNTLLLPNKGRSWSVAPLIETPFRAHNHSHSEAVIKEIKSLGVFHHGSVMMGTARRRSRVEGPAIYMGTCNLSEYYFGVKKHHMLFAAGLLFIVDGYQFKDVRKVGK